MEEREDTGVICATVQNNKNEFGFEKGQNRANLFWKMAWDPCKKKNKTFFKIIKETKTFFKIKKETSVPNRKFLSEPPIFWFTNKKIVL
jgi:hypothetical protein